MIELYHWLFAGWAEITFRLPTEEAPQSKLLVLVLVAQEDRVAEEPITGFNVIEHMLERGIEPPRAVKEDVSTVFSTDCKKAEVFLKVSLLGATQADPSSRSQYAFS